jgi:transcriptional regulator of acetoin/glycerol metabolism
VTFAEFMTARAHEYLSECLAEAKGNTKAAAEAAGMSRSGFYRMCLRAGVPTTLSKRPDPFTSWIRNC